MLRLALNDLRAHLATNVGDADPVWRYHKEKVSDTFMVGVLAAVFNKLLFGSASLVRGVIAAWLAYLVIGKLTWLYQAWRRAKAANAPFVGQHLETPLPRFLDDGGRPVDLWAELRDVAFDCWLGGLAVILAALVVSHATPMVTGQLLVGWLLGYLILIVALWGRP